MVFLYPKIRGIPVYVDHWLLPCRECDHGGTRVFGQWSRHWTLANILSDPVQIQCTLTSCGKACIYYHHPCVYVIYNDWLVGTVVQLHICSIDCAKMAGAGGGGDGIGLRWCSWLRFGYLAGGEWAVAALAVAREGRSPILAATVRCSREEDLAPELEDI